MNNKNIEAIYERIQSIMETKNAAKYIKNQIDICFADCVVALDPDGYDELPADLQDDLYEKFVDAILKDV